MALTFPAAHAAKLKLGNVEEDWLVQLYYDAAGANDFIGISETNRIVSSVQYYGIVEHFGEISQRINLKESKASTAYVNINVINKFKTGSLSDILYGGSNKYLNRKVKIYSCLNDETTLSNCALLFEGKLIDVVHDQKLVTLSIEQKTPWDYITIPNTKTSRGVWVPVVYGDYTAVNDSTTFADQGTYHPVPVYRLYNRHIYAVNHQNETTQTKLHIYEPDWDVFAPMTDDNGNAVQVETGIYALLADYDLDREFKARPPGINTASVLTDDDNAIDNEGDSTPTTYGYVTIDGLTLAGAGSQNTELTSEFKVDCPDHGIGYLDSFVVGSNIYMKASIIAATDDSGFMTADIQARCRDNSYSQDDDFTPHADYHSSSGSTGYDEVAQTNQTLEIVSEYSTANRQMPNAISLKMRAYLEMEGSSAGDEVEAECLYWVYDMWVVLKAILDFGNHPDAARKALADVKTLYSASDGFSKGYSGGSGVASLPHEIHRDMMDRFADLDYADAYMDNWSDLNTARSGWACRWWITDEPVYLKDVLEQIQFEGCFIFLLTADSDGSGNPGGRYVWVKNSYSSGNVLHTYTEKDYDNLKISMTDIKDVVTDTTYNYMRHAATDDYRDDRTYTNSTARTAWAISTLENKETVDLDFIQSDVVYESGSDTNPNDCIALYYDNIKANPRIITNFELKNVAKSDCDLGDIIQLNDSRFDPYGKTWGDLYFMIVEIRRGLGKLYIQAREVYEA